jgi:hypothetical protein|tara:strand:- start:123 stop:248 length:126 start_codon:yes stop_codon:yes gene_type:complete
MISQEFLREYPIGGDTCNKRSSLWREDYRENMIELEQRLDK